MQVIIFSILFSSHLRFDSFFKFPKGICQVFFCSPEEADVAISMLDGRIFVKDKIMKASTSKFDPFLMPQDFAEFEFFSP